MTENQNNENQGQDLNELLRQLAESQGEGDAFAAMFRRPTLDETKVNETLTNEIVETQKQITEFENSINAKLAAWEEKYGAEVLEHSSLKAQQVINSTL
jgi:hypothetical protein